MNLNFVFTTIYIENAENKHAENTHIYTYIPFVSRHYRSTNNASYMPHIHMKLRLVMFYSLLLLSNQKPPPSCNPPTVACPRLPISKLLVLLIPR